MIKLSIPRNQTKRSTLRRHSAVSMERVGIETRRDFRVSGSDLLRVAVDWPMAVVSCCVALYTN